MSNFNMASVEPTVRKFVVAETGCYDDQFFRPYELNAQQNDLNLFQELVEGQTRVSSVGLASVAGSLLNPRAVVNSSAVIANGWGTRRCRFILIVEFPVGLGNSEIEVITGYTDYLGVSLLGRSAKFDPSMLFYINSTMHVRQTLMRDGPTPYYSYTAVDASHLIMPSMSSGGILLNSYGDNHISLLRPQDVLGGLQTNNILSGEIKDTRNKMVGHSIKKSRRSNSVASDYLARTVNAIVASEELKGEGSPLNNNNIYSSSRARDDVKEPMAARDSFLRLINDRTTFRNERNFSYKELCGIFPYLDNDNAGVTMFVPRGRIVRQDIPDAVPGVGMPMSDSGPVTQVAVKLANNLPAIMMDLLLMHITCFITNESIGGVPSVRVDASEAIIDIDKTQLVNLFIERVVKEVLPAITDNNRINFNAFISVDVLGNTHMRIGYAGNHITDYLIPSFCDNLFTPVISDTQVSVSAMATDVKELASFLIDNSFLASGGSQDQNSIFLPMNNKPIIKGSQNGNFSDLNYSDLNANFSL